MQEYDGHKLIDPRDKVTRSVGITEDSTKRLEYHLRNAKRARFNEGLRAWINELTILGLSPELIVLETISHPQNAETRAREQEQHWIQELSSQGVHLLHVEGLTQAYGNRTQTARLIQFKDLKQYRLRARLSIVQLARKAPVDETTVRRAETGQAAQEVKAFAIAEALSNELGQELSDDDLGITIYGQP
jgi:hypothetical protein